MSLSVGLVGMPNVGKSTLLNALSNARAEAANYPFCTIDKNVGVVEVPDDSLLRLRMPSNRRSASLRLYRSLISLGWSEERVEEKALETGFWRIYERWTP